MRRGLRGSKVKLPYLMTVKRGTYVRRKGMKLIRMPDLPYDHPEFLRAYAEALEMAPNRLERSPGTLSALCEAATKCDRFKATSKVYQATLLRQFNQICDLVGHVPARGLRDIHVRKDVHSAVNPADRLKAWRFLAAFGLDAGLLDTDPATTVKPPKRPKTDGHPPWTLNEIAAFRDRWEIGTATRLSMELLFWTGARIGDAVTLGPGMIDRAGRLAYRQHKVGAFAYVPWTCPPPAYAEGLLPDRDLLHAALASSQIRQMTFLATPRGSPRSHKGLGNAVRIATKEAGFKKSAHGLRKSRAIALADAGATTHQIASWTGHQTLKEVDHYTREASRKDAVTRNGTKTESANNA